MKNTLSAKLHAKGIGMKSKVKLTVGIIVDEWATAQAALAELAAQLAAQAEATKKPGAETAEVPLKNETISVPIGFWVRSTASGTISWRFLSAMAARALCASICFWRMWNFGYLQPPRRSENMPR